MTSGIYKITNIKNNKFYVGSSVNIRRRLLDHLSSLEKGNHSNKHLQMSYLKYGKECFIFSILEVVDDINILLDREQYWIDKLDACNKEIAYNINPIATKPPCLKGYKFTEEHCKRISLSNKNRKKIVWVDANMVFDGINIASKVLNISREGIRDVCKPNTERKRYTVSGQHFVYYEDWLSMSQDDIFELLNINGKYPEISSIENTIENTKIY